MSNFFKAIWREFSGWFSNLSAIDGWMAAAMVYSILNGSLLLGAFFAGWLVITWVFQRGKVLARENRISVLTNPDATLEEIDDALLELKQMGSKSWADVGVELHLKKKRNKKAPIGFVR